MTTKPSGLLVFFENLQKFLNTFDVQKLKEKDQKKKFHPTEAIARIKEVSDFIENCEVEVRQVAGEQASDRILQGPDRVCSAQAARDIKLTIQTLERISSTLEEISPLLLDSLDLKALTTLVVENLFAEMRQGNKMPLVLQLAHRFSSAMREYLKCITKCSFIYYTSPSSYYTKQVGFLSFHQFPSKPKPFSNALVTRQQLDQMRTWRAEFGQSVRRQTVQSMTAKDSDGMLPMNCYETKAGDPKPVEFARLTQMEEGICSDQSSSPEVLICEGSIVCVRKGSQPPIQPSPFYLARLDDNMYAVENPAVKATYFAQDPLLPFQFVKTTITGQLKTTSILSSVANFKKEDDTIVLDDVYYCLLVESLDSGDTRTLTEATEEEAEKDDEIQPEDDTLQVSTRSGRRSAGNKNSDFVFYQWSLTFSTNSKASYHTIINDGVQRI